VGSDPRDAKRKLAELDDPDVHVEVTGEAELDDELESGTVSTTRPQFDVQQLLEASEIRERAPTITDEATTEQARLASVLMDSTPPHMRRGPASSPNLEQETVGALRMRLSPLTRIPSLQKKLTELGAVLEDPKTAYVLGFVDGILPLETIIEVTGLPEIDTLQALDRCVVAGVIAFRPPKK
jgi:hypothetical protein